MARALLGVLSLIQAAASLAQTPPPFDAQREVSEAVASIRKVAIGRDKLDWTAVDARAQVQAKDAKDEADLLPVYGFILAQLDDHGHSRLLPPPQVRAAYVTRHGDAPIPREIPPRALTPGLIEGRPVAGIDVALKSGKSARMVNLPGSADPDAQGRYAGAVYTSLTKAPAACGYIVDFREDTGGNLFPMVAGLSPLLGNGYRMMVPTGTSSAPVVLERGAATGYETPGRPGEVIARVPGWQDHPGLAAAPVAVLLSRRTDSSGEEAAMQFLGRANTRSFGEATAGETTANLPVRHSGGTVFFVTSALFVDRNGRSYPDGLRPDVMVEAGPTNPDRVVSAATAWLAAQPRCRR